MTDASALTAAATRINLTVVLYSSLSSVCGFCSHSLLAEMPEHTPWKTLTGSQCQPLSDDKWDPYVVTCAAENPFLETSLLADRHYL